MKKQFYSLLTGVTAMLAACTNDMTNPVTTHPEDGGTTTGVAFTAKDFIPATETFSRTAITGNSFAWVQATDTIGILPDMGAQVYFVIDELDNEDASKATFTGEAWGLKATNDYTAYYPFIGDIYLKRERVPVDYSVQHYKHRADGVVCPSHDYMAARSVQSVDGESLNFEFSHLGALVEVQFALPEAGAVKNFYLCADDAVFPVKGTFDLTAENVAITPDEVALSRMVAVQVEDLVATAASEVVSVRFMMPPMDLTDKTLKVTVVYDDNQRLPLLVSKTRPDSGEGEYTQFEAGKSYSMQASADENQPETFDVTPSDLSSFVKDALTTLGGTKVRFVTGSYLTSEINQIGSNQENNAYAMRNGDWLEIHTASRTIKLVEPSAAYMFSGTAYAEYAAMQEIDLQGIDFSGVTAMAAMFQGCSALASINFGDGFDTSDVTSMAAMFRYCSSLKSLDLSGFDTSNAELIHSLFWDCTSLESLDLSSFDISKITNLYGMFYNCHALTSITFGKGFDTSGVTDMRHVFSSCHALTGLDLSCFNFDAEPNCSDIFYETGKNAVETAPITIHVSSAGKSYLEGQITAIDPNYAVLAVKE